MIQTHRDLAPCILSDYVNEENPVQMYRFPEEPIGLPGLPGLGFMDMHIGDELGPQGRYTIVRKLGYGLYSTVWLARDKQSFHSAASRYVAIKILTQNATAALKAGYLDEISVLRRFTEPTEYYEDGRQHCLAFHDSFVCANTDGSCSHYCLVTEALSMDLICFRRQFPQRVLPLPILKTVLRHVLLALDYLHMECDIIHTDIKPDNIMVAASYSDEEIGDILHKEPPRYYPTMKILGREFHPVVSQPLPSPQLSTEKLVLKLADFGHAQWFERKVTDKISPIALRAPETILQHPWDENVDIWAIGCLTFELLTGAPLFDPHDDPAGRFTVDDQHLLHMIQLKGQPFPAEMLKRSGKASAFFEPNGDMLRVRIADIHAHSQLRSVGTLIRFQGEIAPRSILQSIRNYKTVDDLTELEAAAASGFLERCLAFLPEQRASAIDLLDDPWLQA